MGQYKSWKDVYPSQWLTAEDLQGRQATVRISGVAVEELRQQTGSKEPKLVLSFVGKSKKMVCNKTQCKALAQITGTDLFEGWKDVQITLAPAMASNGKPTIAILRAAGGQQESSRIATGEPDGQ